MQAPTPDKGGIGWQSPSRTFAKPDFKASRPFAPSSSSASRFGSQQPLKQWSNGVSRETSRQDSFGHDNTSYGTSDVEEEATQTTAPTHERPQYARAESRTIVLRNLSDRVGHKDLVDCIRGGAVLDIFLRSNDRSASISFVEGSAAQAFLNYAKRNDIYLHGKRVRLPYLGEGLELTASRSNLVGTTDSSSCLVRPFQHIAVTSACAVLVCIMLTMPRPCRWKSRLWSYSKSCHPKRKSQCHRGSTQKRLGSHS